MDIGSRHSIQQHLLGIDVQTVSWQEMESRPHTACDMDAMLTSDTSEYGVHRASYTTRIQIRWMTEVKMQH